MYQTYGMPATAKVPKPEERSLDETGFMFVTKCIEVIEARGKFFIHMIF